METNQGRAGLSDARRLTEQLHHLFFSQLLAVLSTQEEGQPYCSLVAFAATDDIRSLVFATNRATRKYANLVHEPRISLLIDNRSNDVSDFHNAVAVTATGRAIEIPEGEKVSFLKLYLNKHPNLKDFVMSPGCAMIRIQVERYYIVNRFQNVMIFTLEG